VQKLLQSKVSLLIRRESHMSLGQSVDKAVGCSRPSRLEGRKDMKGFSRTREGYKERVFGNSFHVHIIKSDDDHVISSEALRGNYSKKLHCRHLLDFPFYKFSGFLLLCLEVF